MNIAVLDDYPDAFRQVSSFTRLRDHRVEIFRDTEHDPAKLAARLEHAHAVVLTQQRSPFPRVLIEQLPRLELISQTGRNASHIDLPACTERGIVVSAGGVGHANAPAELTWGLIIAALRRIPQETQRLAQGRWQGSVGTGLAGKTLGIYAYGRIGSLVAQVGRAFGMRVVCFGRETSTTRARLAGFAVAGSREQFFAECDVISLHLPLHEHTHGIVTHEDLARMKPTALLVNTSRAAIIEAGALVDALAAGRPGRAAIDVYEHEPVLDAAHPLLGLDNVICTPHLGYVEEGTLEAYYGAAIEQILAYVDGAPINVLNPDVLTGRFERAAQPPPGHGPSTQIVP